MATKITYIPGDRIMAVDEIVQQLLNLFNAEHADLQGVVEYGDGNRWRLSVISPTVRHEIRFEDLADGGSPTDKQSACGRATEILNAFAPRYFGQAVNLILDGGGNSIQLTFR